MLKDKINKDLSEALKHRDNNRIAVLRLLNSAIHNFEIEKRSKSGESALTDQDILSVLKSEAKKRKESVELFLKGNRRDLAAKERDELKIIEEYLPPELGEEEVEKIVEEVIKEESPSGPGDFGRIMGAAMKRVNGRASGERVTKVVKERLSVLN